MTACGLIRGYLERYFRRVYKKEICKGFMHGHLGRVYEKVFGGLWVKIYGHWCMKTMPGCYTGRKVGGGL